MASSGDGLPESSALLVDILNVLKNIDKRLEAQEEHIRILNAKVDSVPSDKRRRTSSVENIYLEGPGLRNRPFAEEYRISLSSSLSRRSQDLILNTPYRKSSVESRDPRDPAPAASSERQALRSWLHTRKPARYKPSQLSSSPGAWDPGTVQGQPAQLISSNFARRSGIWADGPSSYIDHLPPQDWVTTRNLGKELEIKCNDESARELWTSYVGDSWTIPPDGRIEMTFQRHILERLEKEKALRLLEALKEVSNRLEYQPLGDVSKKGSFRVTDFQFDPDYVESVAEYRAEIVTGKYREHPISSTAKVVQPVSVHSAAWKRMM